MSASTLSLISATTALLASIIGPIVTLTVAKRQFNASVISTNRQKWIDTFRDRLSELVALMSTAVLIRSRWQEQWSDQTALASVPALVAAVEKIVYSRTQLILLTKDDDPRHRELIETTERALRHLQDLAATDAQLHADIDEMARLGRAIVRFEWNRVKRGV